MVFYGIWRFSDGKNGAGWFRDADHYDAILAFKSQRAAKAVAAREWGFKTYTATKASGWCEIRPLSRGKT